MLKFTGERKDGKGDQVYFLALSRGNISLLMQDKPIPINLKDMGGPDTIIHKEGEPKKTKAQPRQKRRPKPR